MAGPNILNRYEGSFFFTTELNFEVTIPAVTLANSWCEVSMRGGEVESAGNRPFYCGIDIINTTTVRVERGFTSRDTFVEWVVYEFDASVIVHRGKFFHTSATMNTTVPSVDLSRSISIVHHKTITSMVRLLSLYRCAMSHTLTSSTNLRTQLQQSDSGATVFWQVIEFTENISVTNHSATASFGLFNVSIPAVVLAKTFIRFSWSSNVTGIEGEDLLSCRLTSTTNIRMEDFFGGAVSKNFSIYAIEYTGAEDFNVERGYTTMDGLTTLNLTVVSVKSRAMIAVGHQVSSLIETQYNGTNNFSHYAVTNKINSDTSITFQRFTGTQDASVAWELIKFPSADAFAIPPKWNYYTMMRGK